jgi:glycosyltransferase involved in cell wall biosynthesis
MKIIYIANARIPTEKAHGVQIMKMCEAYAANGAEVTLVAPKKGKNAITEDAFSYYGIKPTFAIRTLPSIDFIDRFPLSFLVQSITFAISAFFYAMSQPKDRIILSREAFPTLWLAWAGRRTVYEMHDFPQAHLGTYRSLYRATSRIVTTSAWARDNSISKFGIDRRKIMHYPNGVDLSEFDISASKEEARAKLGLDGIKRMALYCGHLYDWKGAHILAEAAALLPKDVSAVFVGGTDEDISAFRTRYSSDNVRILGRKPHSSIPLYLKAADALVIPNIPSIPHSIYSTSPIKLFEYMASRRPIVASDLPSLREMLSERDAILVPPGDQKALADAIIKAVDDGRASTVLAEQAYHDVQRWTWSKRAAAILEFISKDVRLER